MTENQFLSELETALIRLPEEERTDILQDIREYFANGRNDGKSDNDIALELGTPLDIAQELIGAYDFTPIESPERISSHSNSNFDKVDIQIDTGSLVVVPSDDGEMHVDIEDKNYKQQLFVDILDQTLVISLKDEKKWGLFSFGIHTKTPTVTVQLPQKDYRQIKLFTDNGRIIAEELTSLNFEAQSDNGRIQLKQLTAEKLSARSDNGILELKQIVTDSFTARTDNGRINLKDIQANNTMLESDNGGIFMENVNGHIHAETDNGRIGLLTHDLERNIHLKTDNGGITIETMNDPENVTIHADQDSGKNSIFNKKSSHSVFGDGRHIVRLKTDNGNLTVKRI